MKQALYAVAMLLGVVGCTGGAQNTGIGIAQTAATVATVTLDPATLAQMRQTCAAAAPALNVAANPAMPATLHDTAVYPQALCAQLVAGQTPPTLDSNTPAWLGKTLAVTQDVATAAGIILPVALKLLPLVAAL